LAFFGVRARWIAAVEGDPVPPFSAALGLADALGFPLREGVLCCIVVEGDPLVSFSAALELAFFGVHASRFFFGNYLRTCF
jgi:hypothetical protein